MLLEYNDITPNTTNRQGKVPLFIEEWEKHEGVAKMLLLECNDIIHNTINRVLAETPLLNYLLEGARIMKILLEHTNVNPILQMIVVNTTQYKY